jgi:hypothetical protein
LEKKLIGLKTGYPQKTRKQKRMLVKGPWTWDKRPPEDTMTKKMLVLSPMDLGIKTLRKHKDKKKCWKKAQWT